MPTRFVPLGERATLLLPSSSADIPQLLCARVPRGIDDARAVFAGTVLPSGFFFLFFYTDLEVKPRAGAQAAFRAVVIF